MSYYLGKMGFLAVTKVRGWSNFIQILKKKVEIWVTELGKGLPRE